MNTLRRINIIGLTGQSGSGKSTVSNIFARNGFCVIDADRISREVAGYTKFLDEVKALYPDCVVENKLDRQKMAAVVFSDADKLKTYTSVIFPYIINRIFEEINFAADNGYEFVLLDAPTLFEAGLDDICHEIVSVTAPFDMLVERIVMRDNISPDMAKLRLSAMKSADWYIDRCNYNIVNDSTIEALTGTTLKTIKLIKDNRNV